MALSLQMVDSFFVGLLGLDHGVGRPRALGATHTPFPNTEMRWPWTGAVAMVETVVFAAHCVDLL